MEDFYYLPMTRPSCTRLHHLQSTIDSSFTKVTAWLHANRLLLSIPKTFYQFYVPYEPGEDLQIKVGEQFIKRTRTVKYLGMLIDEDMKFWSHIGKVASTISSHIKIIIRARHLDTQLHILLNNALVLPYITYCLVIWGSNYQSNLRPIITAQKRAFRLVAGAGRLAHTSPLFRELKILKLTDLLKYQMILIFHEKL